MVTRIRWTAEAASQLEGIVQYIQADSQEAARKTAQAILDRVRNLSYFPRRIVRSLVLCFPRLPQFETSSAFLNRSKLVITFLALCAFRTGQETSLAEADLLRGFQRVNDRPFSYHALAA
jgi:hypothetical protein